MSYATYLRTDIEFPRKTYDTLYEVMDAIEEEEKLVATARNELRKLAYITEPNKFVDEDYPSAESWIDAKLNSWIDQLEQSSVELYKLYLLKDNWDDIEKRKDGFVVPTDTKTYLFGDFIPTSE